MFAYTHRHTHTSKFNITRKHLSKLFFSNFFFVTTKTIRFKNYTENQNCCDENFVVKIKFKYFFRKKNMHIGFS